MADYTNSKPPIGDVWKLNQIETDASWQDREPLVTPEQVRARYLFGIALYSAMKDPVTRVRQQFTDVLIQDEIEGAVSEIELETHIDIFPRKYREKHPFDRQLYYSWGFFRTEHRPVNNLDRLTVTTSNGIDVFTVPLPWVETGYLAKGQINLIPMGVALNGQTGDNVGNGPVTGVSAGGAAFLAILGHQSWVPSFWQIEYTTGFPNGLLPRVLNDYVACVAAMRVLSKLAATYATANSASLGIDGLSQSMNIGGPQLFSVRMNELAEQRRTFRKKLRALYGTNIFSGNI